MYKCETCGASFASQAALVNHGKAHSKVEHQFKCDACGGVFKSRAELASHVSQSHPMARH